MQLPFGEEAGGRLTRRRFNWAFSSSGGAMVAGDALPPGEVCSGNVNGWAALPEVVGEVSQADAAQPGVPGDRGRRAGGGVWVVPFLMGA